MAANISSSFSYADFTPVKPRKNRKNRSQWTASPISSPIIDALCAQLRADDWFAQCSHVIEREWMVKFSKSTNARVLCLGLGSPSASPIARIQLAFLTELCKLLDIIPDAISLYDPVFSADDSALFSAMNMHVLPWANSAPEYALDNGTPTLWFMPHCDMELYEALLRANWSPKSLANCFLLGNQLQEYIDNKPTSVLQAKAPCLLRAAPLFHTHLLPPSSAWPTAFNNTAVQVFKVKPNAKGPKAVATPNSPPRPSQSAPGAPRPPGNGNNLDSGESDEDAHTHKSGHADEIARPACDAFIAGPEPDSEEMEEGMVPMDAYMAIFDDPLPLPWRASASASKSALGPGKPPQGPQSSVSTLQQESPATTSDVGTEVGGGLGGDKLRWKRKMERLNEKLHASANVEGPKRIDATTSGNV